MERVVMVIILKLLAQRRKGKHSEWGKKGPKFNGVIIPSDLFFFFSTLDINPYNCRHLPSTLFHSVDDIVE